MLEEAYSQAKGRKDFIGLPPPSTASRIRSMEELREWQKQEHAKHIKPEPVDKPIMSSNMMASTGMLSVAFICIGILLIGCLTPIFSVIVIPGACIFYFWGLFKVGNKSAKLRKQEDAIKLAQAVEKRAIQEKEEAKRHAEDEKRIRLIEENRKQEERKMLIRSQHYADLIVLDPFEFEKRIASLYNHLGFKVQRTSNVNDGGKDIIVWKNGATYLVECKRYDETQLVGRPEIQKFHSVIVTDRAAEGFFITTSDFSKGAREYVEMNKLNIKLINMRELSRLIEEATSFD